MKLALSSASSALAAALMLALPVPAAQAASLDATYDVSLLGLSLGKANLAGGIDGGFGDGTQAAVDRLLFNANYWLAAYESRIAGACGPEGAAELLKAVTVWSTHTLKLNKLGNDEAVVTFERFHPPFAANNRRGSAEGRARGPSSNSRPGRRASRSSTPNARRRLAAS